MVMVKSVPEGYSTVTPYLIIKDASAAIDFYKKAFGATETFRMPGPGNTVAHAELKIGDSMIMLADDYPQAIAHSPQSLGGTCITIHLYVSDVDAVANRAIAAGIKVLRPVENQFYGDRSGNFQDPFGHIWSIGTHVEDVAPDEMKKRIEAMAKG